MVSGLVTSPCDQERIFSGLASEMRIASKSVIGLVNSNGLERYKTSSSAAFSFEPFAPSYCCGYFLLSRQRIVPRCKISIAFCYRLLANEAASRQQESCVNRLPPI